MPDTNSEQNSKQKWTLAIDLAMNLPEIGPHGHLVAQDKMYRLKQFAAETAGTPVTIVVQETVNKIPEVATSYDDFTHLGDGTISVYSHELREARQPAIREGLYSLKRYIIHDGTIDESFAPMPSKGTANDLSSLLEFAGKQYPSERLGLVISSHGEGDDGLIGDTGRASLEEVNAAIKEGLSQSDRSNLDLLDFDSCNGVVPYLRAKSLII
jgi:hypothetical protein